MEWELIRRDWQGELDQRDARIAELEYKLHQNKIKHLNSIIENVLWFLSIVIVLIWMILFMVLFGN